MSNLTFSASALNSIKIVVDVFSFDLIGADYWNKKVFNFSKEYNEVYTKNFEFLRMDSFSAIMILGPDFYFFVTIGILFFVRLANKEFLRLNIL